MESVSQKVAHERELEKERAAGENENLLIILIFTNDFSPEMNWLSRALNAPADSIEESARILQGYGFIILVKNNRKEFLRMTPKGKRALFKIRSQLKAP